MAYGCLPLLAGKAQRREQCPDQSCHSDHQNVFTEALRSNARARDMTDALVRTLPVMKRLAPMICPADPTEQPIDRLNSYSYVAGVRYHEADRESLHQHINK